MESCSSLCSSGEGEERKTGEEGRMKTQERKQRKEVEESRGCKGGKRTRKREDKQDGRKGCRKKTMQKESLGDKEEGEDTRRRKEK